MVNYQDSKIYRIVCNTTEKQYIGSTSVALSARLAKHKSNFKDWKNGKGSFMSSFLLLEGENYQIVLIEEYPCNTKEQLLFRERYWIEQYSQCVNKIRKPISTPEERKECFNNWYKANRATIIEKAKVYREDNKEHYQDYLKQYYIDNKDVFLEKQKQRRKISLFVVVAQTVMLPNNPDMKNQKNTFNISTI